MGLEAATYVDDLNSSNPDGATDTKSQGDNHLRLIKGALKNTFPGMAGRFNRAQAKTNYTAVLNDATSLLYFTAASTLILTAAATLGNGWSVDIFAQDGDVTIDPNAAELVNEQATYVVPRGCAGTLMCDGSEFYFFGWSRGTGVFPGMITPCGNVAAPDGWLLCFGQSVLRTDYPNLFAAISTTFGSVDGTHFSLPDLRGRVPAGQDDMGGTSANRLTLAVAGGIDGDVLGGVGGEEAHVLGATELPLHTHSFSGTTSSDGNHAHTSLITTQSQGYDGVTPAAGSSFGVGTMTTSTAGSHNHTVSGTTGTGSGGAGAHNVVQPTLILNYAIKY